MKPGNSFFVLMSFAFLGCTGAVPLVAQQPGDLAVARGVDASVRARIDNLEGYTVTEHYTVFRGQAESNPAAEMTVRTVYRKGSGKSYTILSQKGSSLLGSKVLGILLDNEKRMSQPDNVETVLIDSANYEMKLAPDAHQQLDGRECLVIELTPRRSSSPFLFKGTLWVDARDYAIVQLQGTAVKSSLFLVSPSQVSRQYATMSGLPMATHATISKSSPLGLTVIKIDYTGYQIELRRAQ